MPDRLDPLADLAGGARTVFSEVGKHLLLSLGQPFFGILDAGCSEQLRGTPTLVGNEVKRRSGVNEPDDWRSGDPEGAPHAVVPDEPAIGVERLFDRLERGIPHPGHG